MLNLKGEKGSKILKRIDLASKSLRRSSGLDNKPKQKYFLSAKCSLAVIGACEVVKKPHILLIITNQHIQEINRQFDGTLNHFGPMVFSANQEK